MAIEFSEEIQSLRTTMENISAVVQPERLRAQIAELSQKAAAPDLWDDPAHAQEVTSQLSHRQSELDRVLAMKERIDDLEAIVDMARETAESDPADAEDIFAEAESDLASLKDDMSALEIRTLLDGEYDERNAVITIRSGAGGVDAADFAEILLRMYLRWAERHGYPTKVMDTSYAEEAGLKSATFEVQAPYAYGTLSVEAGTHRLVRISPFDNQGRRQTSFADSAVRMTHIPTGIVVSMQDEKSQIQNRAAALRVLQSRLLVLRHEEEQAKKKELAGDVKASWGDQMRSYVLQPYQMVKDLRTEYESGNPQNVFDGDIDGFINAGIRWRKNQQNQD